MFKKYTKNNKIIATMFSIAIFGFFACSFHIIPTSSHAEASSTHHEENTITCVDHELSLSNQKNDGPDLSVVDIPQNYIFAFIAENIISKIITSDFLYPPPDDKPLYITNNTFLI